MKSSKALIISDEDTYAESSIKEQQVELSQQKSVEIRQKTNGPLVLSVEVDEGRIEKLVIREGECYKEAAAKFIQDMSTYKMIQN